MQDGNGFEAWRQLVAESAPRTVGGRFAMLQGVLQSGDDPVRFEEQLKSWEHQVEINQKLTGSKHDDGVKVSVVVREAPSKLRDNLLVNSQSFEGKYNQLHIVITSYLNSRTQTWTVGDFRNEAKRQPMDSGASPMDIDHISREGKNNGKGQDRD